MERESVSSSMIASIGYDLDAGILEIEFSKSGQVWQYFDFPESTFYEFKAAGSIGKYFLANIKNHFREARVN